VKARPRVAALLSVGALGFLVACGGESGGGSGVATATRRDSAGVMLVSDPVPYGLPDAPSSAPRVPEWTVADQPELELGKAEGGGAQVFGRVTDAVRLPDGGVVVADGQADEVRAFDASGRHLWTRGGKGGGPQEFRALQSLTLLPGDTIAAWDPLALHLVLFAADGTLAGGFTAHSASGTMSFALFYGLLSGHRAVTSGGFSPQAMMKAEDGVHRDPVAVLVRSADDSAVDTLVSVPDREIEVSHPNGTFQENAVLFGRASHVAAAGHRVYVGDDARWEIGALDAGGKLRMRVRMDRAPRTVTDQEIAAQRKRRIAAVKRDLSQMPGAAGSGFAEQMIEHLQKATPHHTLPAFADLRVGVSGDVWVKESNTDPEGAGRWVVLAPDGSLVAVATVPAGVHVLQVADDFIVGRTEDDLGVQRVVVYRWVKRGDG
jgi:hypothetical protein